jgi:hypothetical protein
MSGKKQAGNHSVVEAKGKMRAGRRGGDIRRPCGAGSEGFLLVWILRVADQAFISEGNRDGVHLYLSHQCRE